jgi:hypothetical protein
LADKIHIQPFEKLNRFFQERLRDEHSYRSSHYSFLKVFQHALSYDQIGAHSRVLKNYLAWPLWAQAALLRLKAQLRKPSPVPALNEVVFIDPGRLVADETGTWHSIYMEKIISLFNEKKISHFGKKKDSHIEFHHTLDSIDRNYSAPDERELSMLREIHDVANKAKASTHWTSAEKDQILSALHVFYDDFRFYYKLFNNQPVKSVVFISHYHNEGLIAALQTLGIRSVEIQHGLISTNDLYYVYSSVFSSGIQQAFFPDRICVYGNYWKRILKQGIEFTDEQVVVAGDYLFHPATKKANIEKQNVVLICAQKNMHEEYVEYAHFLLPWMEKHPDWKWIIKLHPLEKNKAAYEELKQLNFEIVDHQRSLDSLLRECRIQISIYSTTFFDALGFDVTNFSIQQFGMYCDYAAQMVEEGVALPLLTIEDPIEKAEALVEKTLPLKRDDVYAQFNAKAILSAILPTN